MKRWFSSLVAVLALNSASAQLFSPEAFHGALLGTFIGGAVGGDRHCGWSGDGAAIGAGIGLVLGAAAGEARRHHYGSSYGYAGPAYGGGYYAPAYGYEVRRPNYALGGTLLGAASGALIGEGASGKPGQGAAIGAAAGLVLGGLAEHSARQREAAAQTARHNPPNYAPAPVGSVASTTWQAAMAPRHRIPDAPRVPDAPTF